MDEPLCLRDLDAATMVTRLGSVGIRPEIARKIFARVHGHGDRNLAQVGLKNEDRARLEPRLAWPDLEVIERRQAEDGFVKYLFRLNDGHAVEAVRIPLPDPADARALKERRRRGEAQALEALPTAKYTVCVSSQAGCALACDFCATGRLGAIRSLKVWEILAQVRHIIGDARHPVRGVVFMGMGEPFLNYDNVITAAGVLCHPAGFAIAAKAITISTAGVVPMIRRYTDEGHRYRLVVSLGAPTSEVRARLMPIERRWPLPVLMDSIRAYATATGERVTFAYVAIGGVNTRPEDGQRLAELLQGLKAKVNVIDVTDNDDAYAPPSREELSAFREILLQHGIPVVRRYSGGKDIGAACGTLSATQRGGQVVNVSDKVTRRDVVP